MKLHTIIIIKKLSAVTDKSCLTAFMCFKTDSSKILFHSFQPCDLHTLFVKFFININRHSFNVFYHLTLFLSLNFLSSLAFPLFLNGKKTFKSCKDSLIISSYLVLAVIMQIPLVTHWENPIITRIFMIAYCYFRELHYSSL